MQKNLGKNPTVELKTPLVSVIIPAYNQAQYIGRTLESVIQQRFRDYEIIVVNDGSTDDTSQVLEDYREHIQLITQANAGPSAARNTGIKASRGELIAFLDSDDLWMPDMLSSTVEFLNTHQECDWVCGAWNHIDEHGNMISEVRDMSWHHDIVDRGQLLQELALWNLFLVHVLLLRRRLFECCGAFDESLRAAEDWDLWLRLAAHGHTLGIIDRHVASYRRHGSSMTFRPQGMKDAALRVVTKFYSTPHLPQEIMELRTHARIHIHLYVAQFYQDAGLHEDIVSLVDEALTLFPTAPRNDMLSCRYLTLLSKFSGTEAFQEKVFSAISPQNPDAQWQSLKHFWTRKQFLLVLEILQTILTQHAIWFIRKILRKIRRQFIYQRNTSL